MTVSNNIELQKLDQNILLFADGNSRKHFLKMRLIGMYKQTWSKQATKEFLSTMGYNK